MPDNNIIPGNWREIVRENTCLRPACELGSNNYSKTARDIRKSFAKYFVSPAGYLHWQNKIVLQS